MEVILARSAFGARLQRGSGAQWSGVGGKRQQRPSGRVIIGNGREVPSSMPSSVTTTIPILKSSPPPPCSSELPAISAESPSKDDGARRVNRTPRVRPTQRVRFSDVEGRWTYDVDEHTQPVCPDAVSHNRECQRSHFEGNQRPNTMFACTLVSLLCFFTLVLLFQLFCPALPFLARRQEPPNGTRF
ncbi:hypothetical protein HPB52_006915 [Rhipicephalus sanguineus]|uniref:Uncharacterized protein n=1 Tax=Rhipicephalus sanguineus TaxID=34632 RepID=A0A9D4QGY2_RHISA|nr:hypothetical protein HPB52_006915 [Rhipicephalus sanguineus]